MITTLSIAVLLGALPPIAVSLEPADCPTEVQLSRVLAALGARLVPFGSPARATVFAQRDAASTEWSLTLGRPGHNEKRKVTLTGGCDERAAALGAIIERFARPVLLAAQRESADAGTPIVDAGAPFDAGAEPAPIEDAGAPAPPPVEPPPLPLPPPPPPPEPPERPWGVGARAGVAGSTAGASLVAGLWGERRFRASTLAVGFGLEYFGPMSATAPSGRVRVDILRPHFFARFRPLSFLWLEGGFGAATAWIGEQGVLEESEFHLHPGLHLALHGAFDFDAFEIWVSLRGFGYLSADPYLVDGVEVVKFPNFQADLSAGVLVKF